jgi:hypothetical protein
MIKGDRITSTDLKSAFNHVWVSEAMQRFLCFRYSDKSYPETVWIKAFPETVYRGARLRNPIHPGELGHSDRGAHGRLAPGASGPNEVRALYDADSRVPAMIGVDVIDKKVLVFANAGDRIPWLAMDFQCAHPDDDPQDAQHDIAIASRVVGTCLEK